MQAFAFEIKTSAEFSEYAQLHIQRVQHLGQELKKLYPKHFRGLDDEVVNEFLSLHDKAKLSPETLKSLSRFYGRSIESLTSAEKVEFLQLKKSLNAKDFEIRLNFLKQKGLADAQGKISFYGKKLFYIEKIADLVDRGSAVGTAQEFGKVMTPASTYMKSPLSKEMAQSLESAYSRVTKGKFYKGNLFQYGTKALKTAGKAALYAGKILYAPLAIFGELMDPADSIAADEEEFKIFYKKHPELTPPASLYKNRPEAAK